MARRVVGLGIHAYLTRLRLASALEHLHDGADDLAQLALSLGFSSHSHFSTAFARQFGVAPSRWRGASNVGDAAALRTILKADRHPRR